VAIGLAFRVNLIWSEAACEDRIAFDTLWLVQIYARVGDLGGGDRHLGETLKRPMAFTRPHLVWQWHGVVLQTK